MNTLSTTEQFPYTMTYVCEHLHVDETKVLSLCNVHGIQPHRDEGTGRLFFGLSDLETMRRLLDLEKRTSNIQLPQGVQPASPVLAGRQPYATTPSRNGGAMTRADLSAIVDSVSHAKEEILRDLSQLLDDKLSGLDEVVVELIRSKSENDTLREELKRMAESQARLESELSKFRPAAFGFWRKD